MQNLVVLFDVGGTLVDAPDIFEIITRKLVGEWTDKQTYNLVANSYESMIEALRNDEPRLPFKSISEIHATVLTSLARKYGYRDISGQARDITIEAYGHQSTLFPETKSALEKLLKYGVRMIIASDNDSDILAIQMSKHNLGIYFSEICISETARAYKPTRGFVFDLNKYLPDDPNNCFVVGDSRVDIDIGRLLGINSILVDRRNAGNGTRANHVIRDLNGLFPLLGLE